MRRRAPSPTTAPVLQPVPLLAQESIYVGIDVGKRKHVAGFVSPTLLARHQHFEGCPAFTFEQSREGFRALVERMRSLAPLEHVFVLVERTGHYHQALVQYLLDLDVSVYLMHVRERQAGLLKTDKRDALGLANQLYLQLELGAQLPDKRQLVRRAVPPSEAAAQLRRVIRRRYELAHDIVRHKNKLTAICDELFPEFTRVLRDPNLPGALLVRQRFPTPQAVATASLADLCACRRGTRPSKAQFQALQEVARTSIGTRDLGQQHGLCLEQKHLIQTLQVLQEQLRELDAEIGRLTQASREGRILLSIPGIGPIQAATIIAAIGHIDNFSTAAALRAYFGWAPQVRQSGTTVDQARLGRSGTRTMKQAMFLIVGNAVQLECEWARIYARLVKKKCVYSERKQAYVGKVAVMGRIAGQMIGLIYMLLKRDADLQRHHGHWSPAAALPEPTLYDPAIHHAHCQGHYRSARPPAPRAQRGTLTLLP